MLAQCVENGLEHLTTVALGRAEKGLIRERPRDIQRYLTFVAEVALFALDSCVKGPTLLVVDVLVGARLDQAQPLQCVATDQILAIVVGQLAIAVG